jgi:hypothetical protein
VDAKHPSLRQFDGECVVCHTVGFNHPTGYADALRAGNKKMAEKLRGVGCESCHGPGSAHVADTRNTRIHALMNPWKAKGNETKEEEAKRLLRIDVFCQTCHDRDNDVHWDFAKKWPKVIHMTPRKNAVQQPAAPVQAAPPQPLNIITPPATTPQAQPELVPPQPLTPPIPQTRQQTDPQDPERRRFLPNVFRLFRRE